MGSYDKLGTVVPYSLIKLILNDDKVFNSFINGFDNSKKMFGKISKYDYIESINQYLDFSIKLGKDLPKSYFDKVNYINSTNGINKQYDYEEYLDRTERIVSISLLESILTDAEVLDKFLNYKNNRDIFTENLETYINALTNFIDYYRKNNVPILVEMKSNYDKIINVYVKENEDLEKTAEIILISILESILNDDKVFRSFINDFDNSLSLFGRNSKFRYIESLNQYIKLYIKLGKDLPKSYFDKINYINSINRINKQYDYEEYLERTDRIIPISFLESILTEEEILNKFLSFEDNREIFPLRLEDYLNALSDLLKVYKNSGIELLTNMEINFKKLERIYIFEMFHNEEMNNDYELKNVDKKLEETVFKRVNMNAEPFQLARAIYIELCKLTSYDATFYAYQEIDRKGEKYKALYNKPVELINLENNKVTCRSFSEIYATLLNKVGIKAIVAGKNHKYTLFLHKGVIIKADATNKNFNIGEEFKLPDIIRVKLNLPTAGFRAYNIQNDISYVLEQVDIFNEEYQDKKISNLESRYKKIKGIENKKNMSFEDIIFYLSSIKPNKLIDFEYTEYLKMLVKTNLDRSIIDNLYFCTCYEKELEAFHPLFMIDASKYIDDEDSYFLFSHRQGLIRLSLEELKKIYESNQLLITNNKIKSDLGVDKLGSIK